MPASWERSVVRVLPAGSDPAATPPEGAGFLVSAPADPGSSSPSSVIVTCAHVVLACRPEGVTDRPDRVQIVFDETNDARDATVEAEGWRPVEAGDIAILHIVGALPEGIDGLALGSSLTSEDHEFRTLGYPNGDRNSEIGTGRVKAIRRTADDRPAALQLSSEEVTTGYSGGPIWDEPLRRVVGMVSRIIVPDAYGRGANIAYATPTELIIEACPGLRISEECPYRGLEPFTDEEQVARFFFGRDEPIGRIMGRLRENPPPVIAVFGPSGSGKSSLVQAGVIPQLREQGWLVPPPVRHYDDIDPSLTWPEATGPPRQTLIVLDQFEETLPSADAGRDAARERAVIDRRRELLSGLAQLVERPSTTVMIVMRNDFYSQFVKETPEALRADALANLVEIPAELTRADLMEIIVKPAELVGLRFEPGLDERIADDAQAIAAEQGDASYGVMLPLLEFALTQLWRERELPYLTLAGYRKIGGVVDGLTRWADQALLELSSGSVDLTPVVRRVMVELVHFGNVASGEPDSRTSVTIDKLKEDIDAEGVDEVITALERKRLLIPGGGEDGAPRRVQLAHDTLIRRWKKLQDWLNADRAFALWEQAMMPRAERWKAGSGALLRDGELAEAERRLDARHGKLAEPLREWIVASIEARREAERAAHAARERLQRLAGGMTVAALLFLGVSILALVLFFRAEHETTLNRVQSIAAQSRLAQSAGADEQAALLAREAWRLDENHELPGPVGTALQGSIGSPYFSTLSPEKPSEVQHIAYAGDGLTMAVIHDDGTIEVATAAGPVACEVPPGAGGDAPAIRANRAAFSDDGTRLAIASRDSFVHLWRLDGGSCTFERSLAGPGGQVSALAVGTDGDTLTVAMGSCHTTRQTPTAPFSKLAPRCAPGGAWVRVWELRGEPKITADRPIDGRYTCALAIDTGRHWLAASGCEDISPKAPVCAAEAGPIALWPLGGVAETPACLAGHAGDVRALAFDPCTGQLASGGNDRAIRLWDPATATVQRTLTGHTEAVRGLAFSRNCVFLGSASEDGGVGLWYLPEDQPVIDYIGTSTQWVRTLAFGGADGLDLSAEAPGGRVRTWHLGGSGTAPAELRGHTAYIRALAFSPRAGDQLLASVAEDGTLRLWDLKRPWAAPVLPGFGGDNPKTKLTAVAFSSDGRLVVAADSAGRVWVWDVAAPDRPLATDDAGDGREVVLAFHPGSYHLAVGTRAGTVQVWQVMVSGAPALARVGEPVVVQRDVAVTALAFSPDGETLATGDADGQVTVRSWRRGALPAPPAYRLDGGEVVNALAFSPDGTKLASGGDDAVVRVWSADARYALRAELRGHEEEVRSLVFTPDGATLASGSRDQTVRLWSVESPDAPPVIIFGLSEWVRALAISPDGEVLAATATQGRIRLLVPDSDTLAARVCEHVSRNLTEAEWIELIGSDPAWRPTCRGLVTPDANRTPLAGGPVIGGSAYGIRTRDLRLERAVS